MNEKYTVSKQIKLLAISFMLIGLAGIVYGFVSAPSNIEEAKEIVASKSHGSGHGDSEHGDSEHGDSEHGDSEHGDSEHGDSEHEVGHEVDHDKHLLHQLQNKPWASIYVPALFFMLISLGTLAFYAIQRASQAGWSIVLYRVMEGITGYLLIGCISVLIILLLSGLHFNHLFIWMDPDVVAHDEIIRNKSSYLNLPSFFIRAIIYVSGWILYRNVSRKLSLKQDNSKDINIHKKLFKYSAGFLVFFLISESMMSWDWIMSIDPHWFSTLFGWYVFAGALVSGVTVIAIITIYLKSINYLKFVGDSHIHDLGKFMFGVSIFWAYLWFSQFMLIWYSNIPEEVTYFITRIEDYNFIFFGMVVLNLIFPLIVLMNSDFKKTYFIVILTGIVIIIGHYIDVFNMIMPSAVGDQWSIGFSEIGGFLFFLGLFILVVFREISKAPLLASGDPFAEESKGFKYYYYD
ncbi:MAG: quinol:cytochrome C oxidoreductase [Euryarchaeota archaeon]|nr:quinol:cytochrome C oxidoreductase [Euryarchaeota archaeon]